MKITNGIIKYLLNTLNQPGFTDGASGPTGYAIYRNIRILENEVKDYEKVINDALNEFGKKSEDGRVYIDEKDTEAIKKFTEKVDPIAALEVNVDLYQIPKDDFIMPYCATATPSQYVLIEDFLVLPEKEEENKDEELNKKEE
jgi:hypothetical protein